MQTPWLEDVVNAAHGSLLRTDPHHPARGYLRERGVTDDEIVTYRIGYWADQPTVVSCTPEFWSWSRRFGGNRLVFPLTNAFGFAVGMQVRHMGEKGYENFVLKPRDLYVPVFGLHVALPVMYAQQRVVLVEGVFDYFALVKYAPDTLCTLTANVTNAVKRILARYTTLVICCFDMDETGRRGAYKLAGLDVPTQFRKAGDTTRLGPPKEPPPYNVMMPYYTEHDPDDLRKAGKDQELRRIVLPTPLMSSFAEMTGAQ